MLVFTGILFLIPMGHGCIRASQILQRLNLIACLFSMLYHDDTLSYYRSVVKANPTENYNGFVTTS